MTDRDRLAADLHAMHDRITVSGEKRPCQCVPLADRLIALGWTRLDEERLHMYPRLIAERAALRADLHRRYLAATSDDEREFLWREIRLADRHEERIVRGEQP